MTTHAKYTYIRNDRLLALIQYLNRANFVKEKENEIVPRTYLYQKGPRAYFYESRSGSPQNVLKGALYQQNTFFSLWNMYIYNMK